MNDIDTTAAAWFLFGVVVGMAVLGACLVWDRAGKTLDDLVKPEQPSTRPTSSARKAGRGRR